MITTLNTSAHDLRAIPDGSVHAVMTSPPYYGLRSYAGEQDVEWPTVVYRLNEFTEPVTVEPMRCALGLEPSPVAYIGHLILCLREWRRVLRDDGCVFVNLGDSYANNGVKDPSKVGGFTGERIRAKLAGLNPNDSAQDSRPRQIPVGLKPKDLLMIPAMFAFAARADGWYLRSEIIWAKPNPMPESVTDRPTKAHEQVFLLAKSSRYYWDAEAVREPLQQSTVERYQYGWNGDNDDNSNGARTGSAFQKMKNGETMGEAMGTNGRNIRTVWNIATRPYAKAHYAVWPETLVEPMILASTSARGCCPQCGAPWKRVVEKKRRKDETRHTGRAAQGNDDRRDGDWPRMITTTTTTGWEPTCACDAGDPIPCTILDPFAGSGTTGRVAVKHRRAAILCDISGEYLEEHVPDRTTVQMRLGVVA